MSRPCVCDRLPPKGEPYSTNYCRLCWLYHNDPAYQKFWDAKPGLGDRVASLLEKVGITKERVEAVTGRPCGCAKRQQALNNLGEKLGL